MKNKLIPKFLTPWGPIMQSDNTRVAPIITLPVIPNFTRLNKSKLGKAVLHKVKKENPDFYNKKVRLEAHKAKPNSEIVRYEDAKGKTRTSSKVIGMSGADPIASLYVEGVALNPVFKLAGRAAQWGLAKAGNNWARAKIINRLMQNIAIPDETIPNNVGWAPKLTLQVSHASDKNKIPDLYFEKRWDVVNEGANPHGIWYQGKLGTPRTNLTNPGKGEKALKARDLFANRKYHLLGEVTFEKPMLTIGDVKDRSKLSYDADNMGADGLIYNDVYDNGYNHNLVILGWKLFDPKKNYLEYKGDLRRTKNSPESSEYKLDPVDFSKAYTEDFFDKNVKKFFKKDVEKRTDILDNYMFVPDDDNWYKYELHDFQDNIIGDYTPRLDRVRISKKLDPIRSYTTKVHEFRHKLESKYPLNYWQRNHLDKAYRIFSSKEPRIPDSRSLSEKSSTNTELRASLYNRFIRLNGREPENILELNTFIDGLSKMDIRESLRHINGYGQDYVESILERIREAKEEGIPKETIINGVDEWVDNIKQALKYVPAISGTSLIPTNKKGSD